MLLYHTKLLCPEATLSEATLSKATLSEATLSKIPDFPIGSPLNGNMGVGGVLNGAVT